MDANKHPLRIMRDRYNLSIAALERETGVSKRTIIRIQQGYSTYPETRRELCDYFTKLTGTQTTSQQLGLTIENEPVSRTEEDEDMKRRQLLQTIIIGGAALALSPQEAIDRLVHAQIAPSEMNEDTLAYFAKLNENCWHVTNGSELASIEQVLPTYVPQLAIVAQQQSQHQREAANLTSQGYLLAGLIALDQLNFPAMERHSQLAVHYSELAEDYNLHAAV